MQNFDRFLAANPAWRERLAPATARPRSTPPAAAQLATELLAALVPFTDADRETHDRLVLLKQRADDAAAAAYRMEVRLGVVLRMRALLNQIAGRVYLERARARPAEREQYAALRACEDVNFLADAGVRQRRRHGAAGALPAARRRPPGGRGRHAGLDGHPVPAALGDRPQPASNAPRAR